MVENNFSGQFARHLRAESGFTVDHVLTRYDGEPFEPAYIAERVKAFLEGKAAGPPGARSTRRGRWPTTTSASTCRTRRGRVACERAKANGYDEPVWEVELVSRADGRPEGTLVIGMDTGSMYGCHPPVGQPAGGALRRRTMATAELTLKSLEADVHPDWCPGCGDFGVLKSIKEAILELGIAPHEVLDRLRHRLLLEPAGVHPHLRRAQPARPRGARWPPAPPSPTTPCT